MQACWCCGNNGVFGQTGSKKEVEVFLSIKKPIIFFSSIRIFLSQQILDEKTKNTVFKSDRMIVNYLKAPAHFLISLLTKQKSMKIHSSIHFKI